MKKNKGPLNKKDSLLMEFFIGELRDIYWAEEHLIQMLPRMAKSATTVELSNAFSKHLKETEWHSDRLVRIFNMTGRDVSTKKCEAMAGILREGNDIIADTKQDTMTRDAGLIFAGQKAEHYEIATYGGLVTLAQTLGLPEVAELLEQTLKEEKAADNVLSDIAKNRVNTAASGEEA